MVENAKKSGVRHLRWRAANPEKWRCMRATQKKKCYGRTRKNIGVAVRLWIRDGDRQIRAKRRPADRELSRRLVRCMQTIYQRRSRLGIICVDYFLLRRLDSRCFSLRALATASSIRFSIWSAGTLAKAWRTSVTI